MANFNKVYLMGNLTRDPEMRVTPKGTAICQFGLAISRSWKDESGQTREETAFVDIEAWGKQGEIISKYCTKGRPLFVEGRLKFDQWEDKTSGQKRSKLKVVLENFQFIGGRGDGAPGAGAPGAGAPGAGETAEPASGDAPHSARAPVRPPAVPKDAVDDDVPF
jgi:single-strand DNA-binding protein